MRFGYDGRPFAGWARQPGLRTVEWEIERGIQRHRLPIVASSLSVASRTDRGVSAIGNALALESRLSGPSLLRSLNGISPAIYFTRASTIPSDFRVRAASRRTYRYFESTPAVRVTEWRAAARWFSGSIDVRSLGRRLPSDRPQWRRIDAVTVHATSSGLEVDVVAPSFVWGMVRKIIGALREVDLGRISTARLASALAGKERLTLPMAEPEPLVLWDVEYPIEWAYAWVGPTRHQARWWEEARNELLLRSQVVESLAEGASSAPASPPVPSVRASVRR